MGPKSTPVSCGKDLIYLGDALKMVNRMKRLGLALPLSDLSFKEGEARPRPPFSESWIRDHLLKPGALGGLNKEARCILLAMVNTGARPSELAALTEAQIHLDAFKACPKGFPKSRCSSASLSATVNKFLRSNGLMETPDHSLYGLRHSFEDRLLTAGIDERIRRDLFGHALNRERYGKGASLSHVCDLIQRVAY